MSIGTFGSFTQARLAIYAAQSGLSVTGNNISNVNTKGYTRQRLDQSSLHIGGTDRYANPADIRTGQGVLCTGVSQLRDPYLDIRYRTASASVGALDVKLGGLEQIASILDEVGKGEQTEGKSFGILGAQIMEIYDALGGLTDQTGHAEYNRQVRAAAENLTHYFNKYAGDLQEIYDNAVKSYEQDVKTVNGLLTSIRGYNEEIRRCDIHGDKALELRDQRNVLIDELSEYMKINVTYSMEEISPGLEVEKCTIALDDANPDSQVLTDTSLLVDGIYATQLQIDQVPAARELDPLDKTTWPYLDAKGQPTMFAGDAAQPGKVVANPNAVAGDDTTNYIRVDADGKIVLKADGSPETTDDENQALKDVRLNPDADLTKTNSEENPWFLGADGKTPTTDMEAARVYEANPDYLPYLDGKNNPTADLEKAQMVNNPNFSITLDALRDKQGYLHYITEKQVAEIAHTGEANYADFEAKAHQKQPITTKDPDTGNTIISNYYKSGYEADGTTPIYTKQDYIQILSTPVHLDDNDLYGALQSDRELLTEEGEFTDLSIIDGSNENALYCDEKAATKRGIPYYQRALDLLARQFAQAYNEANKGYYTDNNGNYISQVLNADGTPKLHPVTGNPEGQPVTVEYDKVTDDTTNPPTTEKATYTLKKGDTKDSLDPAVWKAMEDRVAQGVADGALPAGTAIKTVEDYLDLPMMQEVETTDAGGNPVTKLETVKDAKGNPVSSGIYVGGNLFSNHGASDDDTNITASNISIAHSWSEGAVEMIRSFECAPEESEPASGASDNYLHLQGLIFTKMDYIPSDQFSTRDGSSDVMFNGTFSEMWDNIGSVLANDQKVTKDSLTASYETRLEVDTNRDSVSAVDFNDEAMNLMMYAKSYNAACRLMTTIDSVLDKLVNNTGVTT